MQKKRGRNTYSMRDADIYVGVSITEGFGDVFGCV